MTTGPESGVERRIEQRRTPAIERAIRLEIGERTLRGVLSDISATGAKLVFQDAEYSSVRELLGEATLSRLPVRSWIDGHESSTACIVWYGLVLDRGFAVGIEFASPRPSSAPGHAPSTPVLVWGVRHRPEREAELALTLGDVFRDLSSREFSLDSALGLLCEKALALVGAEAVLFWGLEGDELVLRAQVGTLQMEIGSLFPERDRFIPDFPLLKKALQRKQQLFANRALESPFGDHSGVRRYGLQSLMFIPVFGRHTDFGVLLFAHSKNPYAFGSRSQAEAEIFANQAALFLEKASMLQNLEEAATFFKTLNRVALAFHSRLDIGGVLKVVCEEGRALFGADVASVFLRENGHYVQRAAAGMDVNPTPIDRSQMRLSESALVDRGEGFFVNDVEHHALARLDLFQRYLASRPARSLMVLPIWGEGETLGTLALVDRSNPHRFSSRDLEKGKLLAEQAAQALANARLYERVAQSKRIIRQQDRFRILGELAGVVAHEIKNALVPLRTLSDLLPARYDDADFREWYSRTVRAEVERMHDLVGQLSRFQNGERRPPERTDPAALLKSVVELLGPEAASRHVTLELEGESGGAVFVVANELRQVLVNLMLNAIQAVDKDGVVRAGVRRAENGEGLLCWVSDTGAGIAPGQLERIFDPLFTTKQNGSGLGLAVARDLVKTNGGSIQVESTSGHGTTFTILLPEASPEA